MMRVLLAVAAVCAPLPAIAQPTIVVGDHNLQPDTAGQEIKVFVTGGQAIDTLNLNVQIEDGLDGPTIQDVDAIEGTIFDANNDGGQFDTLADPRLFAATVLTEFGTAVPADGLLATIFIDTTGLDSGTFDLKLADTFNGDTDFGVDSGFAPIIAEVTNGRITIVPEPATALLAMAAGGLAFLRLRV